MLTAWSDSAAVTAVASSRHSTSHCCSAFLLHFHVLHPDHLHTIDSYPSLTGRIITTIVDVTSLKRESVAAVAHLVGLQLFLVFSLSRLKHISPSSLGAGYSFGSESGYA